MYIVPDAKPSIAKNLVETSCIRLPRLSIIDECVTRRLAVVESVDVNVSTKLLEAKQFIEQLHEENPYFTHDIALIERVRARLM